MRTALLVVDAYLVGLGVIVALVVYPAFRLVGTAEWPSYHQRHTRAIGLAVAPIWLAQGVLCAVWILSGPHRGLAFAHGFFAALGVLFTVVGAVPQHNALALSQSSLRQGRLEAWHLARTATWIAAIAVVLLW